MLACTDCQRICKLYCTPRAGNSRAQTPDGGDISMNQVGSTLHWGPDPGQNRFYMTHGDK
ncbi:hypothetical protein DPMN_179829 [Dreissena polymorpha]|uniref:Uncharacterized protein n=1 Tax=Dreissena polymorpha TaxID=45954 RepID=A0A9D4ED31_DREPO|nr:hypothetical protein DPMN_179829 [Dreissena polymorpha]